MESGSWWPAGPKYGPYGVNMLLSAAASGDKRLTDQPTASSAAVVEGGAATWGGQGALSSPLICGMRLLEINAILRMHHRMESVASPAPAARISTRNSGIWFVWFGGSLSAGRPARRGRQNQGVIHTPPAGRSATDVHRRLNARTAPPIQIIAFDWISQN